MIYKIDNDVLVSGRGTKTQIFKKRNRGLTSVYLKKLKSATAKHLNKVDKKTNYHDVLNHLDEAGLSNNKISTFKQFIDLIEKHITEHSESIELLGPNRPKSKRKRTKKQYDQAIQDKTMEYLSYLRSNFHLHSIKFDRSYIVEKLKDKKLLNYKHNYHRKPYMQWTH